MVDKVLFSKKSDIWSTPKDIYNLYIGDGYFDPCPINPDFDGLSINWASFCFVNPPYSDIKSWLDKAIVELESGRLKRAVFLVPARTDTKWFHELVYGRFKIEFIKGRLKFGDSKNSAPFPSMYIYIE